MLTTSPGVLSRRGHPGVFARETGLAAMRGVGVTSRRGTASPVDHCSGSGMIQHVRALWKCRHFLMALVKLDLRQRYRRSVLGVGWSLLNPIAMTIVFTVVFSNLLGNGDPVRYAASVLTGMAVWGFLRESALNG